MKQSLMLLLVLFGAFAVRAQSTNAPSINAAATNSIARQPGKSLETQIGGHELPAISLRELKPNELAVGRIVYSGITIEAIKKRQPLQLINPLATAEFGSPEDNIVRDPINGRVAGLKIFAIRF